MTRINGKESHVYLTESEVFDSSNPHLMNPLIFYRVKHPTKNMSCLPLISMRKFYEQSTTDDQIEFTIKTVSIETQQANKNYIRCISSEQKKEEFAQLS